MRATQQAARSAQRRRSTERHRVLLPSTNTGTVRYPAAEMKHGPIALIDPLMPVVMIAIKDSIYLKVGHNLSRSFNMRHAAASMR